MSFDSIFTTLYRSPVAVLPTSITLPGLGEAGGADLALLRPALVGAVECADGLLDRLQNQVLAFGQIQSHLDALDDQLAGIAEQLTTLAPGEHSPTPAQNERAYRAAVDAFGPLLAEACAVYDDYFGVVRVPEMGLLPLLGQVVRTSQAILRDLPYTLLDRTQIVMLAANIGRMLAAVSQRLSEGEGNSAPAASRADDRQVYHRGWQQTATPEGWSETVAFYRWKLGHHFFDLCTIFCGDALGQAHAAIAKGDEPIAVTQLALADAFLRGTTAAMWYAGDFPANLYRDVVRPSMIMPGKASGFSGDQNADYNRMKDAKERLKAFLCQHYGPDLAGLSPRLRRAFLQFHEADIEDNEHHLIIAAHKVGMDQSLAQKEWQDELPAHVHRQMAVDVLREMAESKRREFVSR
ncbi:MAG: hypothetical protein KBG20_00205 [Caldilineaceae bacterium]|nr:hypothetical protein [Caldilineaceae bacterium]MBP8107228.1 hypothetical protein [Caldilineaceae bacterium]MBP8121374.1 hypothetical protein [Caldilineaceae bacterium]MBP9070679.1 hypothetical protein [Caldilineaceae bacterium]